MLEQQGVKREQIQQIIDEGIKFNHYCFQIENKIYFQARYFLSDLMIWILLLDNLQAKRLQEQWFPRLSVELLLD